MFGFRKEVPEVNQTHRGTFGYGEVPEGDAGGA